MMSSAFSPAPLNEKPQVAARSLTIVVPIHDEVEGIPRLVEELGRVARDEAARRPVEVVVVDDGSGDGGFELLRASAPADWRLVQHDRNLGLTAALRSGTEAARHELVGWLDADLTYEPALLSALAARVDAGAEVAVASCHHPAGRVEGVGAFRCWLSRSASRLYRRASGHPLHTFTCMVRVQPRALALSTWPERPGYLGVTEQLLRAIGRGARIDELPAVLRARCSGRSKMRVARVARAHLSLIAAVRRGAFAAEPR